MRQAIVVLPLLFAACHSGGPSVSATNASASEVQAKIAAAGGVDAMVEPGRWEGAMTVTEMKMPKLPPEQQAMIAGKLGKSRPVISCVTPEDVKANRALFTGNASADKSCKYDHFTMGGGTLDASMSCDHDGAKMAATMKGSYSPTTYKMDMRTTTDSDQPYQAMTMAMTVDAKRTGACRGTESKE